VPVVCLHAAGSDVPWQQVAPTEAGRQLTCNLQAPAIAVLDHPSGPIIDLRLSEVQITQRCVRLGAQARRFSAVHWDACNGAASIPAGQRSARVDSRPTRVQLPAARGIDHCCVGTLQVKALQVLFSHRKRSLWVGVWQASEAQIKSWPPGSVPKSAAELLHVQLKYIWHALHAVKLHKPSSPGQRHSRKTVGQARGPACDTDVGFHPHRC
jgi:hypothetical protein